MNPDGSRQPLAPNPQSLVATSAFALTALIGVWAAYDRSAAWTRFALIAVGLSAAWGIAWSGQRWGTRALGPAGAACALLAAAIAAFFLLRYDWAAGGSDKFGAIRLAGMWQQARLPALLLNEDINGNVAGGTLALLLPLAAAATAWAWRRWKPAGAALALAAAVALLGLALSASRGAWAGLIAGTLVAVLLGWIASHRSPAAYARTALLLGIGGIAASLLAAWAATTFPGLDRLLGGMTGVGHSALSRTQLWRDGLTLVGDYPFTGAGLGSTMMVYSTYALMLHVGFITHSHNLFLQIAVEQGLPGLATFVGMLMLGWHTIASDLPLGGRVRGEYLGWRLAAAASLTALVVHGTVDAAPYVSRLLPVMFLPLGFAWASARAEVEAKAEVTAKSGVQPLGFVRVLVSAAEAAPTPPGMGARSALCGKLFFTGPLALAAAFTLTLTLILALTPPGRAAFQANWGAVAQTRTELSVYEWPAWPIQDALRRAPAVDLAPALEHYAAALALQPGSPTANRRLGQIELSRGEYAAARTHLEVAAAAAPNQSATRRLLGEVYAIIGDTAQATALWRDLDFSQGQLPLRVWWYEHIGEKEKADRIILAEHLMDK